MSYKNSFIEAFSYFEIVKYLVGWSESSIARPEKQEFNRLLRMFVGNCHRYYIALSHTYSIPIGTQLYANRNRVYQRLCQLIVIYISRKTLSINIVLSAIISLLFLPPPTWFLSNQREHPSIFLMRDSIQNLWPPRPHSLYGLDVICPQPAVKNILWRWCMPQEKEAFSPSLLVCRKSISEWGSFSPSSPFSLRDLVFLLQCPMFIPLRAAGNFSAKIHFSSIYIRKDWESQQVGNFHFSFPRRTLSQFLCFNIGRLANFM